jgi:hypothetical protein
MSQTCVHINLCRDRFPSKRLCPDCGNDLGFPNVRRAREGEATLQQRCTDAKAANNAASKKIKEFEDTIDQHGCVVIAIPYVFAEQLLKSDKPLYANYHCLIDANARFMAEASDHERRVDADNRMFPGYEREISFGSLSINNVGVWSFGPCHITLSATMVMDRTTFTHQNTYNYQNWFESVTLADGHMTWKERPGYRSDRQHKATLAVAKLAGDIKANMHRENFAGLLLRSTGDRHRDDFVEAHIYGTFTRRAIVCVRTPDNKESKRFDRKTSNTDLNLHRKNLKALVGALKKEDSRLITNVAIKGALHAALFDDHQRPALLLWDSAGEGFRRADEYFARYANIQSEVRF